MAKHLEFPKDDASTAHILAEGIADIDDEVARLLILRGAYALRQSKIEGKVDRIRTLSRVRTTALDAEKSQGGALPGMPEVIVKVMEILQLQTDALLQPTVGEAPETGDIGHK